MAALLIFEVMDKEPALWWFFLVCGAVGVVGFLFCRWKRWTGFVILPLCALFAHGITAELRDPYVGPMILQEAGYRYVIGAYVAAALSLAIPAIGLALQVRARRVKSIHV